MRKLLGIIFVSGSILWTSSAYATTFYLPDTAITHVEFYGSQFTIYLDNNFPSNSCRTLLSGAVAMDSATEPGKSRMAALLTAMVSGKKVSMYARDNVCSGDRMTIDHFVVFN